MHDVAIAGIGMTRFTKQAEKGYGGLVVEAVTAALADAKLRSTDMQAVFVGSVGGGDAIGQKSLKTMAFAGAPVLNLTNACASGSMGIHEAWAWVKAGIVDCALAVGVEILSAAPKGPLRLPKGNWIFDAGLNLPAWYAMRARKHMTDHGLTVRQLASVAVKSRRLAVHNPRAHFREEVSLEQVLGAPVIADPLTLHQCCPKTDGAAAAIVCSADFARARGLHPVWIRSAALGSGSAVFTDTPAPVGTARRVATQALEAAGLDPGDLDVVEVHDAFTIGEILYTEALGVCPPGEGGRYVESGKTLPDGGGTAVNPSGGLLSRGHPLGGTGVAQLAEVVWQLRGECGPRQVSEPRLGAVHTMGASDFELDGNICAVFVLEKDAT